MYLAKKIRLYPTKEQEILFRKFAGVARWAYNYFLTRNDENHKVYLENNKKCRGFLGAYDLEKEITQLKKLDKYAWLNEVDCDVYKKAFRDAEKAYKWFFDGKMRHPKFKSKKNTKPSFRTRQDRMTVLPNGVRLCKIGYVRTARSFPPKSNNKSYSNTRITYDGKYWYLSVDYEVEPNAKPHTDEVIGIDVDIEKLATCSNGDIYSNINKTDKIKKLEKKLKREQHKLSRMVEMNTKYYKTEHDNKNYPVYYKPLSECKNIQKQKRVIKLIYRKMVNIRNNHLNQITSKITKALPKQIVIEDLDIEGLKNNKHRAKMVQEAKWYEFGRQLEYKSQLNGIEFIKADRFFPSSKRCSCCGYIKKDLKLSDRIYVCPRCGQKIDRDYNAALNLCYYGVGFEPSW